MIIAGQSIATALARYNNIQDEGTPKMREQTVSVLGEHVLNYLRSKMTLEGFFVGFSTRQVMVDEFADAKRAEIIAESPKAKIPTSFT